MNIDEIKQSWVELKTEIHRLKELNERFSNMVIRSRSISVLKKVERTYKIFTILCLLYSVISFLPVFRESFGETFCVVLSLYFLIIGGINIGFLFKLKKINLNTMPVAKALIAVSKARIDRYRRQIACYVIMIPVMITLLVICYRIDFYMFIGGVTGAIFGGVIGYRIDKKISGYIREIENMLNEELEDAELND